MRNKIPITMSMKSARFMFIIMWLKKKISEKKRKVMKKKRNNKENYDFLT